MKATTPFREYELFDFYGISCNVLASREEILVMARKGDPSPMHELPPRGVPCCYDLGGKLMPIYSIDESTFE